MCFCNDMGVESGRHSVVVNIITIFIFMCIMIFMIFIFICIIS